MINGNQIYWLTHNMYAIIRTLFEEQKMQSKAAVFLHLRPIYCALTTIVMIHVSKINEIMNVA
jgi:hypothetical protein